MREAIDTLNARVRESILGKVGIQGGAVLNFAARQPAIMPWAVAQPAYQVAETMTNVFLVEDAFNVLLFGTVRTNDGAGTCILVAREEGGIIRDIWAEQGDVEHREDVGGVRNVEGVRGGIWVRSCDGVRAIVLHHEFGDTLVTVLHVVLATMEGGEEDAVTYGIVGIGGMRLVGRVGLVNLGL